MRRLEAAGKALSVVHLLYHSIGYPDIMILSYRNCFRLRNPFVNLQLVDRCWHSKRIDILPVIDLLPIQLRLHEVVDDSVLVCLRGSKDTITLFYNHLRVHERLTDLVLLEESRH